MSMTIGVLNLIAGIFNIPLACSDVDGLLTVTLPKDTAAIPKQLEVKVK